MEFEFSEKVQGLRARLQAFMDEHVYPNEATYAAQLAEAPDRWQPLPISRGAEAPRQGRGAVEPVPGPQQARLSA